jgi:hypothetical protein
MIIIINVTPRDPWAGWSTSIYLLSPLTFSFRLVVVYHSISRYQLLDCGAGRVGCQSEARSYVLQQLIDRRLALIL